MHQPVVLIDLQRQQLNVQQLQQLLEYYAVVYVFHPQGDSPFGLEQLTDLAQLITSQDVVILEHAATGQYQYDYALVAGQLVALLASQSEIHIISAMPFAASLVNMLALAGMQPRLIPIRPSTPMNKVLQALNFWQASVQDWSKQLGAYLSKPLQNIHVRMNPAVQNTLQQLQLKTQQLQTKLQAHQIYQVLDAALNQWQEKHIVGTSLDEIIHQIIHLNESNQDVSIKPNSVKQSRELSAGHTGLQIDPLQFEVAKQLHHLKEQKPKDIYALRDFLAQSFPESDVRRLLKELIDKGYIHCEGVEVRYSHEMYLN